MLSTNSSMHVAHVLSHFLAVCSLHGLNLKSIEMMTRIISKLPVYLFQKNKDIQQFKVTAMISTIKNEAFGFVYGNSTYSVRVNIYIMDKVTWDATENNSLNKNIRVNHLYI